MFPGRNLTNWEVSYVPLKIIFAVTDVTQSIDVISCDFIVRTILKQYCGIHNYSLKMLKKV